MPRPIVAVLDVETTGLGHHAHPPRLDGVIQIGMACRKNGRIYQWSSYCNPGTHYLKNGRADAALRINGISLETVLESPPAEEAVKLWTRKLQSICPDVTRMKFKSYNKKFDQPFLASRPWNVGESQWSDCIMLAAQKHLGWDKWPKLSESMDALGIDWPRGRQHDAATDAHAALLVHEKIIGENNPF